jgi:hypothetical protein
MKEKQYMKAFTFTTFQTKDETYKILKIIETKSNLQLKQNHNSRCTYAHLHDYCRDATSKSHCIISTLKRSVHKCRIEYATAEIPGSTGQQTRYRNDDCTNATLNRQLIRCNIWNVHFTNAAFIRLY